MAEADRNRVLVWASDDFRAAGSGILVADRIVLTSADACPPGASPAIGHPGSEHRYAATRIWPKAGGESPAILLEIIDHEWMNESSIPRWGVVSSSGLWIKSIVDGDHPVALEINNLSSLPDGCWESRPSATQAVSTMLSDHLSTGAGVYSGQTLIGVHVRPGELRDRPLVMPVARLLADEDFRAIVDRAAGRRIRLEPAEFAGTIRAWRPEGGSTRPSALLLPEYETVPLSGREFLTQDLLQWCADRQPRSGALLIGPPGQGKRRLTRHVADILRDREWVVGELADRPAEDWLTGVTRSRMPLFLVAELGRHDAAISDLAQAVMSAPGAKVRVLLLGAEAGPRWSESLRSDPAVRALFTERVHRIGPLAADTDAVVARLNDATIAFAAVLSTPAEKWLPGADGSPTTGSRRYPTTAPDAGNALRLHIAALAAVLTGMSDDQRSATGVLLDHEERHWRQATSGLPVDAQSSWPTALATALLFGAATETIAIQTLQLTPALERATETVVRAVAAWIHDLQPPEDPDGPYWGTLRPRPLLLEHVGQNWTNSPLLSRLLPSVEPAQARHALSLLLETGDPTLLDQASTLTAANLRRLGPELVDLAYAQPAALTIVTRILDDEDSDLTDELCVTLLDRVPTAPGPLSPVVQRLCQRLIDSYEHALEAGSDRVRPGLAAQLTDLAVLRAGAGSASEAADLARRAVEQYQWLVASGGSRAGYVTSLADGLVLYARLLDDAGRPRDAVEVARQAAEVYRKYTEVADPAARPEFAATLQGQAEHAVRAGDLPGAVAALTEAVGVLTAVVDDASSAATRFDALGRLADALSQQADVRWDDGQAPESLAAREDAVLAARRMYAIDPASSRPLLLDCLDAVARTQNRLGRSAAALETMGQSLRLWRQEAEDDPPMGLPALASAAIATSIRLSEAGHTESAIDTASEAVESLERLDRLQPGSAVGELALAQHTLSLRLAEAGRWKEAAGLADRSLSAYAALVHNGRTELTSDYAAALVNRAAVFATTNQHAEAAEAAERAIDLLERFGTVRDDSSSKRILAAALTNAAVALGRLNRGTESLAKARQAVELHGVDAPAVERVRALAVLRDTLLAQGGAVDAAATAAKVVELYTEIGRHEPKDYLAAYAVALHEAARCLTAARMWERGVDYGVAAAQAYENLDGKHEWLDERTDVAMLLCVCYAESDRSVDAASAAEQAVALHREAALDGEDRDPAQLADTLDAVSALPVAALGSRLALSYADQAVAHRRPVAARGNPEQIVKLVRALRRLAARRAEIAGPEEALPAAREAVAQGRVLKEFTRLDGMAEIAVCLRELSEYLAGSGREADSRAAAADAAREAADEYRALAAEDPARYLSQYAAAALDLSHRQAHLTAWMDALLSAQAAVVALDLLPATTLGDRARLGQALVQVGLCRTELHNTTDHLDVAQRAVDLYARLSAEDSSFEPEYAVALRAFAEVRAGRASLERRREAARRAAALHGALVAHDPDTYRDELEASQRTVADLQKRNA